MIEVNDENFTEEVKEYQGLVVLDFWAPWCNFCVGVADDVVALSEKYTKYKFVKINCDEAEDVCAEYKISFIPSFVIIENGKEIKRFVSQIDVDRLSAYLAKH